MILVIDNYDSFTYNLVHYLGELGASLKVFRNDKITVAEIRQLAPEAIVLSPGPCTPNEAGICLDVVRELGTDIPILGVCLGHQTIGQAVGGDVIQAPSLMHGKVSEISCTQTGLFDGLPGRFNVTRYHSLLVDAGTLPNVLTPTAQTDDGLIMAFDHVDLPLYGVQFHPESIASEHGHALLQNFLRLANEWNVKKGRQVA